MTTRRFKATSQDMQLGEGLSKHKGVQKRVIWNLEDKIAKVIEKGVAVGINMQAKKVRDDSDETRLIHGEVWDLEVEVANVLETGAALGFDFHGEEMEITEILTAKEKEDEDRFKK